MYIYIYIYICVCVCVPQRLQLHSRKESRLLATPDPDPLHHCPQSFCLSISELGALRLAGHLPGHARAATRRGVQLYTPETPNPKPSSPTSIIVHCSMISWYHACPV